LLRMRDGDFAARLPSTWTGVEGKVADTFNEIVAANEQMARELKRLGQKVGKEGRTRERSRFQQLRGSWGEMETSVNTLVDDLLRPTTDLTNEYNKALWCGFAGLAEMGKSPPLSEPSINIIASITWGAERYRYPTNLPKVAATGGPHCMGLPNRPFNSTAKVLIADTGSNPVVYGNPQLLLNFDGLKQLLYGPIDGPPRNPAQVGQQG